MKFPKVLTGVDGPEAGVGEGVGWEDARRSKMS